MNFILVAKVRSKNLYLNEIDDEKISCGRKKMCDKWEAKLNLNEKGWCVMSD